MRTRPLFTLTAVAALVLAWLPVSLRAQDAKRGAGVYTEQKCALCHSIAGRGNPKGPLDTVGSRLSADEIRRWLTNPQEMAERTNSTRQPMMKSYADLSAPDLDALVAYLQTLK